MADIVKRERRGRVLEVTLDRPKANAFDAATSREIARAFVEFREDPELWVAILTGTGRFFSAGWDLNAAAAGEDGSNADYGEGGFAGLTENYALNKPVIGAVNGYAFGGGFEIALACDILVASTEASFALSEVNVGLIATGGGIIHLPQRIPRAVAHEMLYTGRRMNAEEALRVGLVSRVVEPEALMDAAREIAADILSSAPLAVQAVKSILRDIDGLDAKAAYAAQEVNPEANSLLASEDAAEGPRAFTEKRPPIWKAR